MPEHRLAAYAALLAERGRRPSDAEAVRSAVTVRRDRLTMRQWDRRLRPAEREALRQLLRDGVLVRVSELQTDAAGRPYVRKVVTEPTGEAPRGADRAWPAVTGRQLACARRVVGLSAEELAQRVGVAASGIRRIEASPAVPRGHIAELVAALGLPTLLTPAALHTARTDAGWRLEDVAARVGVRLVTVHAWEQARRPIPPGRMLAVAAALHEARECAPTALAARRQELADAMVARVTAEPGITDRALLHEHRSARVGRAGPEIDASSVLDDLLSADRLVAVADTSVGPRGGRRTVRVLRVPEDADTAAPDGRLTAARLRRRREQVGAARGELDRAAGLSAGTVYRLEKKGGKPVPLHLEGPLRAALERFAHEGPPSVRADADAARAICTHLRSHPGTRRSRISYEVANTKAVHRALTQLLKSGAVVERPVPDSQGRIAAGLFLADDAPDQREPVDGRALRAARHASGWTVAALASALGVRANTVARWETGARHCPPDQARRVTELLETPAPPRAREERRLRRLVELAGQPGGVSTAELPVMFRSSDGRATVERAVVDGLVHVEERVARRSDGRTYVRRFLVAGATAPASGILERMSGAELRRRRQQGGLTQRELARLLGNGHVTISGWETGRIPIPPGRVPRVLDALAGRHTHGVS